MENVTTPTNLTEFPGVKQRIKKNPYLLGSVVVALQLRDLLIFPLRSVFHSFARL